MDNEETYIDDGLERFLTETECYEPLNVPTAARTPKKLNNKAALVQTSLWAAHLLVDGFISVAASRFGDWRSGVFSVMVAGGSAAECLQNEV
jgi:hypothetical protein